MRLILICKDTYRLAIKTPTFNKKPHNKTKKSRGVLLFFFQKHKNENAVLCA